jgi:glucose/arabinose dehydrogenase
MYYAQTPDGRSVAAEQVKAGVARSDSRGKERQQLDAVQAEARAARRGCLWQGQPAAEADGVTLAALSLEVASSVADPARPRAVAAAPLATTLPSGFVQDVVTTGLTSPTAFAFLPDGRILIAEKDGLVRVYKNGAILSTPFIDLRDRVNDYWDHGLLGIAPDPSFATNGHVYLLYTYENNAGDYSGTKTARLARYTATGDVATPSSEAVILGKTVGSSCNDFPADADCLPSDSPSHSVGSIKFAADGTMFVSAGDGAHFNFVDDNALRVQNLDSLAGKLLRVTTSGAGLQSNPFWKGANANRSKVWALGLRNAYRINLRPGSGIPYLGDVGWNNWEEASVATKGANLGWPCYEGAFRQSGYEPKPVCQALYGQGSSAVRPPLVAWDHGPGSSAATGGTFYTGTAYPIEYQGAYFYADYAQNWIRSLRVDANDALVAGSVTGFATAADNPVALEIGLDGNLYYLSISTGQLRRIRYDATPTTPTPTPTTTCSSGQYLAEYFNNVTLSGSPASSRCEARIDYDWGSGGPGVGGVGIDNFSVRWTGRHPFQDGSYTFTATADDGIRVWLDGALIIDAWQDQPATTYQVTRTLTAGEHEVKVEYYERGGGAIAKLSWQGPASTNRPPVPTISAPSSTQTFRVGTVISFSGSATDPEEGAIPESGLSWTVNIQHCSNGICHPHLDYFNLVGRSSGSFSGPDHEEEFHLEIVLTARDAGGLTSTASVTIQPQTSQLTLVTSPTGLQVVYNGTTRVAPHTSNPIVGGRRTISAPSPQGGHSFTAWSDGGAQQHDVTVGDSATTYTASFTATGDTTPPTISDIRATGISNSRATITWSTNEPSDSQVEYGTTTAYGSSSPLDSAHVTAHSVRLTGLTPNTTYYYRVKSKDTAGNLAVSAQYTFATR